MTKQELIRRVQARPSVAAIHKKEVGVLVDAVFAEMAAYFIEARVSSKKPPRFTYPGFGTFTKKRRPPRAGRNPRTGEEMIIPESVTLAFSPGQELKAHLNREPQRGRRRG